MYGSLHSSESDRANPSRLASWKVPCVRTTAASSTRAKRTHLELAKIDPLSVKTGEFPPRRAVARKKSLTFSQNLSRRDLKPYEGLENPSSLVSNRGVVGLLPLIA
jgi:hypothetical protein